MNVCKIGRRGKCITYSCAEADRHNSIEAKLLELGWERDDFPYEWDSQWHALMKQPRELTPYRTLSAVLPLDLSSDFRFSLEDITPQTRSTT